MKSRGACGGAHRAAERAAGTSKTAATMAAAELVGGMGAVRRSGTANGQANGARDRGNEVRRAPASGRPDA